MKQGRTLSELAAELERQAKSKKDFVANTSLISFEANGSDDNPIVLNGINGGMTLRPTAHQQMASALSIPKVYYDKCLQQAPELLARNVNEWLHREPAKKLIRTLDGQVRAILSDSYRPLDNLDLAEAVLPKLASLEAEPVSCEVTEARMYIKAVTPKVQAVLNKIDPSRHDTIGKVNDIIQAGVVVSNSEVGHGSLRVEAMTYRLICLNGAIHEAAIRKAHLGRGSRGQDAIEDAREFFRTETRIADDRAFFLKVQDAVAAMFDVTKFAARIDQYRDAADRRITHPEIPQVVEVVGNRYQLNDGEKKSVLRHLIEGGSLTAFGIGNAITRAAQDCDLYDRASDLESFGAKVFELKPDEWRAINAV